MCKSGLRVAIMVGAIVGAASSGRANIISYAASLSADAVVPPSGSIGFGSGILDFHDDTGSFGLTLLVVGISTGDIAGAAIHVGPEGTNGPSILDLVDPPDFQFTEVGPLASLLVVDDALFPGGYVGDLETGDTYIEIETGDPATAAVRGQLILIPEPQTLALLGVGAVFGLLMRHRHRQHAH